eukprot:CAMPEP_0203846162 /NCGR_PEP_ID=MMETSP0359-20131031/4262_1 /ASSEMBLY_ACC=CAM_ASM_000338 /TAXON_ID=268821 /ORGANISM="Scrippsiella Hangoei, Strain SHTV-5" /LENGTH=275 /DNA_ID=CAMNT_0050761441 /DNA_START=23 /DNA_END=851 /DNA_ORIENTATION=+
MSSARPRFKQHIPSSLWPLPAVPEFDDIQKSKPPAASRRAPDEARSIHPVATVFDGMQKISPLAASRRAPVEAGGNASIATAHSAAEETALQHLDRALFGSLLKYVPADFTTTSRRVCNVGDDDFGKAQALLVHAATAAYNSDGILDWVWRDMQMQPQAIDRHHTATCRSVCSTRPCDDCVESKTSLGALGIEAPHQLRPLSMPRTIGGVARSRTLKPVTPDAAVALAMHDKVLSKLEVLSEMEEVLEEDVCAADALRKLQALVCAKARHAYASR